MSQVKELHRSYLFVPGSEPRRVDKSLEVPADVLIFDLEDAVLPHEKSYARQLVVDTINAPELMKRKKIIRVNGVSTPWFEDDIAAISECMNTDIMLPKCESVENLNLVRTLIKQTGCALFGLVETARGVLNLADIVRDFPVPGTLCFGHVDFAADMELSDSDASKGAVYHARCQIALASKASGLTAIDNICLDVCNEQVIRDDALLGMHLGYGGKLCIHPRQVVIVNEVYTPTADQVSRAKAILTAWEEVKQQDVGVFVYENKMIDLPAIRAQEHLLKRAEAISISHTDNNQVEE